MDGWMNGQTTQKQYAPPNSLVGGIIRHFFTQKVFTFFLFLKKMFVFGTHQKHLAKWLLISTTTHLHGEIRQIVCVEVFRPTQPNGVMSSAVSLPSHTFTEQA